MRKIARQAAALIILLALLGGCVRQAGEASAPGYFEKRGQLIQSKNGASAPAQISSEYLLTTEQLSALLNQPNVVVVDARSEEDYKKLHISGAVSIPKAQYRDPKILEGILEYKKNEGFFIPPEMAEKILGEAGIDANTRVIVYDSITFPDATAVWALLKYFGHENVQILKGGFEKWVSEGRSVTSELPKVQKKTFVARPRPEMVASREWILKNKESIILLDLRSFEEYVGVNPAGNPRGGHVPGAISVEWLHLAGSETFRSPAEMQKILEEAGVTKDREIVTYCNIGFGRSTYGLVALKMLGYDKVRVYGGSFEDWSNASELQVATTEIGSFKDWIMSK